jgi:hypothetical protein
MGLILATVALGILGVFGACCSKILADEFKAWVPFFVERIISIAVGRAPEHFRERLAEEWRAYVNDKPGDLGKLCAALDLIRASAKSSSEALRSAAEDRFREAAVAIQRAMRANAEVSKLLSNDDDDVDRLRGAVVAIERAMRADSEVVKKVSKLLPNDRLHEVLASLERDASKSPYMQKLYETGKKASKLLSDNADYHLREFLAGLEHHLRNASKTRYMQKLYIDVQDARLPTCHATADGRHRVPNGTVSKIYGLDSNQGRCALCGQTLDPAEVPDC